MLTNINNLEVLYEDNHIICINKKVSDIIQGDKTGDVPLSEIVKNYIKKKYNKQGAVFLGIVHRIDRPTFGVIIFAKTSKALERLNKMMQNREIKKTYFAVVEKGELNKEGTLIHYLVKKENQNKSYAHRKEVENSKKAILHYEIIKKLDRYLLLKINLETGRHHQIRSQFSKIEMPIKGDLKYGAKRSNKNKGISLCAYEIEFIHPVKKEKIIVKANLPKEDIWKSIKI